MQTKYWAVTIIVGATLFGFGAAESWKNSGPSEPVRRMADRDEDMVKRWEEYKHRREEFEKRTEVPLPAGLAAGMMAGGATMVLCGVVAVIFRHRDTF